MMSIKGTRTLRIAALSAALLCGCLSAVAEQAGRRYVITDFGAVGDGHTVNTGAIQAVIDRCAGDGGGVVVVPSGTFLTGALFFKQGVDLAVEKSAVLKSTTNPEEFPDIDTRWEGIDTRWMCALLNFQNMTNVHVSGEGTVDGSGMEWLKKLGMKERPWNWGPDKSAPRPAGVKGKDKEIVGPPEPGYRTAHTMRGPQLERPQMMLVSNCEGVRIEGLHFEHQAIWCLHLLYSQDVDVDHVTIHTGNRIGKSDGIDIDSCDDVRITGCDLSNFDDNISLKSGWNEYGRKVNRPTENITISDCTFRNGDGLAMGSELSGSIRHVLVERCRFIYTKATARIKSKPSRGGVIEDVVFRDIKLENVWRMVDFLLAWNLKDQDEPPAPALTETRGIRMINFSGTVESGGLIIGLKGGPFRDLKFVNCHVTAKTGVVLENTEDVDLSGLDLKVAEGPAIIHGRPPKG